MLLYIITIFIFCFYSYKKIKRDLFNMSLILCNIEPNVVHPIIKKEKNLIKTEFKKTKILQKRKINNSKDSIMNINNKIKTVQ